MNCVKGILLICICLCSSKAFADDLMQAKKEFMEGQALFDASQYEEASAAFQRAFKLAPSWKLHYNIGQCETAAKNYGAALGHFEKFIIQGGDEIGAERSEEVLSEMKRLRQLVGTLRFLDVPDGSRLTIDGKDYGTFPLAASIRVVAGLEHNIEVSNGSDVLLQQKLVLGATESITISAGQDTQPLPDDGAPQSASASEQSPSRLKPLKIIFWASASMAMASAGLATGFWVAADAKEKDFNTLNSDPSVPRDDSELLKLGDKINSYDKGYVISMIGAGVFAAAAITAGIIYKLKKKKSMVDASGTALTVRF